MEQSHISETVDRDFVNFIASMKKLTGIDLALYKEAQMKRRLTSFRIKKGYQNFSDFFNAVKNDRKLMEELLDRMTINVSEFFRNPGRWDVLEKKIIPELMKGKSSLKVWSAACSTGEEPYSLVIALNQFFPLNRVKVTATDIDEGVINKAKEGIYDKRALKNISAERLKTYFEEKDWGRYQVKDEVKKQVHFKRHNLLADSFEKNHDLIVCRNVIIYFTDEAKHLLYQKFSDALNPGGILFVGSTEQIFQPQQYGFETYDTFFYRKMNR